MKLWSIKTIKEANKMAGQHFFSPDTMKFFNSEVEEYTYDHKDPNGDHIFFVTSEQFEDSTHTLHPRTWSVRSFNPKNGHVRPTPDEFARLLDFNTALKKIGEVVEGKIKYE
jgi:hypothetical protein